MNPKEISELISKYRAGYENACDDLYYGYGYNFWSKTCTIENEEERRIVWNAAFNKMALTK